ncbi:response regulator [Geminocystis sp. NIES-3709]|uniref:response regulator n=1 Tax=Geminocystis sp. NIES-3709 TaxID=1617448 RepID=UPI0005FC64A8|nr:response regulator [Geminocystis sp. NIES-3709]BAQ63302.1 PatA subfamily [Geminocystis sp. NIES-3709]
MTNAMVENSITSSNKQIVAIPHKVLQGLLGKKISGKLIIQDPIDREIQWIIYLGKGKIHFATNTSRKRERVNYLLSHNFSEYNFYIPQDLEDDYQFIYYQWQEKHLNSQQVREILFGMTQEAMIFCLALPRAEVKYEKIVSLDPLILSKSAKSLVEPVKSQIRGWAQIRGDISSPFVRFVNSDWHSLRSYFADDLPQWQRLEKLKPYLDDQCSLYEIGTYSGESVLDLGLFFQPLVSLNLLNVKSVESIVTIEKPLIACIDDSQAIQRVVKMTLLAGGFDVISITEPAKAISVFVTQKPDLILMDINMPDIDGYKLAYMMRQSELLKDIPILMLTGRDGVLDRVKAKMVGAIGYICKPFNPQELVQSVNDNIQKEV